MNCGGRAEINGVTFHSVDVTVTARRKNGRIEVEDNVDFEEYDYVENDSFDIDYLLMSVPFIRGVWEMMKTLISSWKLFMILVVISLITLIPIIFTQNNGVGGEMTDFFTELDPFLPIIILGIGFITIKFTPIGKYHGAEHMVANCFDNNEMLTIANVKRHSRIHENCGTNLTIFFSLIWFVLVFLPITADLHVFLKLIIARSLSFELFVIENKKVKAVLKPVYLIGYAFQNFFSHQNHQMIKLKLRSRLSLKWRDCKKKLILYANPRF